jgi:predicted RNA-binding protein with RPS1 domain
MHKIKINPEKIGTVIGPGGKMIRSIIEVSGATVDIEDDGSVFVGATSEESASKAIQMITDLTREVEVGTIYTGKVTRLMNFGAFVEVLPGKEGLVHISELADYRVDKVEDIVKTGDEITVIVTESASQGRITLSRRILLPAPRTGRKAGSDLRVTGSRITDLPTAQTAPADLNAREKNCGKHKSHCPWCPWQDGTDSGCCRFIRAGHGNSLRNRYLTGEPESCWQLPCDTSLQQF